MTTPTKDDGFLSAVEAAMSHYQMLSPGDAVLVGVSGGPDSVALLDSLVAISPKWSLRLVVAHLNHQLRGSTADEEAAFVNKIATALGLPCELASRDVGEYGIRHRLSVQEAARSVRYAFYDEAAAKHSADKIALGHHADDNAESILVHLLRGTGPLGLVGIPPVRDGRIIRPLIDLTRKEILAYLEQNGLEYVRDHSNLDTDYLRNRIRHQLLPLLREAYNPNMVDALNRLGSILRDEEDFWDLTVRRVFEELCRRTSQGMSLPVTKLSGLHPALLRRVVRRAILSVKGDLKRIGHVHVQAVIQLLIGSSPSGRLTLPDGITVLRDREAVYFLSEPPQEIAEFQHDIPGIQTTPIPEIGIALKLEVCDSSEVSDPRSYPLTTALFDMESIAFPLTVRSFKKGDRFNPLGMSGSQKVKTFFINQKITRSERLRCPILLSKGHIIWVGGYRIDDSVKITEKTRKILKAKLLQAQ
jgi:tRNA(Ile)-lysidine synthase